MEMILRRDISVKSWGRNGSGLKKKRTTTTHNGKVETANVDGFRVLL